MKGFRLRMQTLILVVMIPALLLVTCGTGFFIYNSLHQVIIDGFDEKLFAVCTTSASFVDGDEHREILKKPDENGHLYLQYVGPMRLVLQEANCKYLYSQIVGKTSDREKDITYVLDSSLGDEHSPIGQLDALPAEERQGATDVQSGRKPYVISDMRLWDVWGWLKSCFVPIYDTRGHIVAMMGADIDVNIIFKKTKSMLALVGMVSLVCILFGAVLAVQIARRLTRPIAAVKDGALMVAAGQYGHRIDIRQPRELAELAASFNKLSAALAATVEELNNANRELETRRRSQELRRLLADAAEGNPEHERLAAARVGNKSAIADASGYTISPGGHLVALWVSPGESDPLRNAQLRAEIDETVERVLSRYDAGTSSQPSPWKGEGAGSGAGPGGPDVGARQRAQDFSPLSKGPGVDASGQELGSVVPGASPVGAGTVASSSSKAREIASLLAATFPATMDAVAVLDARHGVVHVEGKRTVPALAMDSGGAFTAIEIGGDNDTMIVQPGRAVILGSADVRRYSEALYKTLSFELIQAPQADRLIVALQEVVGTHASEEVVAVLVG